METRPSAKKIRYISFYFTKKCLTLKGHVEPPSWSCVFTCKHMTCLALLSSLCFQNKQELWGLSTYCTTSQNQIQYWNWNKLVLSSVLTSPFVWYSALRMLLRYESILPVGWEKIPFVPSLVSVSQNKTRLDRSLGQDWSANGFTSFQYKWTSCE